MIIMRTAFSIIILSVLGVFGDCQDLTIVRGRISINPYSQLSIQSAENPVTATRDVFPAQLSDSGVFRIEAEIIVPQIFNLIVDDKFAYQLFLCPNTETIIEVDTNSFTIKGPTDDFYEWRSILENEYLYKTNYKYYENQGFDKDSVMQIIQHIFDWRTEALAQYQKVGNKYALNSCESTHFNNVIKYAVYTYLWSDLMQRGYSIDSDVFRFWDDLPLDDSKAAKRSLDYNRALDVYIFWRLRLENHWYDSRSFDYSSEEYAIKFYKQILAELKDDEVRNSTLTRWVCNLLFSGRTSAESLYKRYLDDCSDTMLKQIADRYYKEYLSVREIPDQLSMIDTLDISLFNKLQEFKGRVLYLDFWASWCSPCMRSLPHTQKIQKEYSNAPFEVIYVNVRDNIGSFETVVKKLDLTGALIYLDYEESIEVLDYLEADGIPHYVLIDKDGVIIDKDAPNPESGAIIKAIDLLLKW